MENIKSKKQSSKLVKGECKFCKCQNYTRQKCTSKQVGGSKLVRQDAKVPYEGDIAKIEKMKVQVNED